MSSENLPHPWHRDEQSGTLIADLSDFGKGVRPTYPNGTPINLHVWQKDMDASGEDIGGWQTTIVQNGKPQKYLIIND